MKGLKIISTGRALPARMVPNEELVALVDTSDEWIVSRTGIRQRYYCTQESGTSLAREAAHLAMERAGIAPEEIAACIVGTSSADYISPATASLLQRELGLLENTPALTSPPAARALSMPCTRRAACCSTPRGPMRWSSAQRCSAA